MKFNRLLGVLLLLLVSQFACFATDVKIKRGYTMSGSTKVYNGYETAVLNLTLTLHPGPDEATWASGQQVKKKLPSGSPFGTYMSGIWSITAGQVKAGGGKVSNQYPNVTDHTQRVRADDLKNYYGGNLDLSCGTWCSWTGVDGPAQFNLHIVYEEVLGTVTPKDVQIYRGLVAYPPNWVSTKYNVMIQARQSTTKGKEYMVVWNNETNPGKSSIPAANPPGMKALLFPWWDMTLFGLGEEFPPAAPFKVYRRTIPGTWALWTSGTCPAGETVYITEADDTVDEDTTPDENEIPDTGSQTNPDGTQSGTSSPNTGNGSTSSGQGAAGAPGGSSGGGSTGGGSGTDGLTQAEVQEAVRAGTKQAANDSTGDGFTREIPSEGVAELEDSKTQSEALGTALGDIKSTGNGIADTISPSAMMAKFGHMNLPTSGVGKITGWDFAFNNPWISTMHVDLVRYQSIIDIVRSLVLALLSMYFWFAFMRTVKQGMS